jgi:NADPH:quinone reductase-like Zn-dependent oxidoreductase
MGGMGRDYDGGYTDFSCVPASQVQVIKPKISLKQLGVLSEMMQTAWVSLIQSLQQDTMLIRGGTTSVVATTTLAKVFALLLRPLLVNQKGRQCCLPMAPAKSALIMEPFPRR